MGVYRYSKNEVYSSTLLFSSVPSGWTENMDLKTVVYRVNTTAIDQLPKRATHTTISWATHDLLTSTLNAETFTSQALGIM